MMFGVSGIAIKWSARAAVARRPGRAAHSTAAVIVRCLYEIVYLSIVLQSEV